ncbi:hypothetical protein P879_10694 [Paragonimus westermani]|uniref:Uncharacterized protein n=1 Tax=Paragonimus westermani TaxID=34504 RepID=A0A8T0DEN6_9TREM|nr:hypothetical protein P879_10694 [Paragonimus westermani]
MSSVSPIPPHPIDRASVLTKSARPCGRTTRSSTRAVKLAPPLAPVAMTHAADMSTQRDLCAACRQTVSPKVLSVMCRLCKLCVHATCDATLTQASIELLNSDSHLAVCYRCAKCRSADSGSSRSRLEDRMGFLEAKLSKLQKQVHPLIHDLTIKPSCATNAEISTTNPQYYMMNSQYDNNPPTPQEDKAESAGSPIEATQNRHKHPPYVLSGTPYMGHNPGGHKCVGTSRSDTARCSSSQHR